MKCARNPGLLLRKRHPFSQTAIRYLALAATVLGTRSVFATTAESYDPSWGGELSWTTNDLFHRPLWSSAWLEDNYEPWWKTRVAHPVTDYSADKLPTGAVRLDTALDLELTLHRPLQGWSLARSPSGINQVWAFTPGSQNHQDRTARAGQNAFVDFGMHPFQFISADIGAEFVGNDDERYWFPVNDEHRLFKDGRHAKVVRGEVKYDDTHTLLRAFEGVPMTDWLGQNDLFHLLPSQTDVEYYRRADGSLTPRGGEARFKTPFGTLDAIGGTQLRFRYGSGLYVKYDAPPVGSWENSVVYRNEDLPIGRVGNEDREVRRWTVSYNSSYAPTERVQTHLGLLYEPFRLYQTYQDVDNVNDIRNQSTLKRDALGATLRTEYHPSRWIDLTGLGYTYLGPVAGNKQQVDADASRTFATDWTLSAAYIYRQPIKGPVPLLFEGTADNPGALAAAPRGPDDPVWVHWDNRKAHIGSLTLVFDPTPGTPFFKYQRNILDEWNLNPDEDAQWSGALQYRVTHYPTNTDRLFSFSEDGTLLNDPIFHAGALATSHPLSSGTGLIRWRRDQWHVSGDVSAGEALAGSAIAYTTATNFYKPATLFVQSGIAVDNGFVKTFARYGQDVWGPADYHTELGWTYHKVYQAGISLICFRDAELGFRYVGTRMTNEFIGSDTGAFNEYRFFATYHFGLEHNFGAKLASVGRAVPQVIPEVSLTASETQFNPDGSGSVHSVSLIPRASAEAGILSWVLTVKNSAGETVRKWEGSGSPQASFRWEGLDLEGKPLPAGTYRASLAIVDLYGNEATSPAQTIEIQSAKSSGAAPTRPPSGKTYTVSNTPEGLRVTLSSLVLFDVNQTDLKESAKDGLDQVIDLLKAYPTNVLRVSGHTDNLGSGAYNQKLSDSRAHAVANYLSTKGSIARTRISIVGYGKHRPVASNSTEEGRQQNRRVEIDILK